MVKLNNGRLTRLKNGLEMGSVPNGGGVCFEKVRLESLLIGGR